MGLQVLRHQLGFIAVIVLLLPPTPAASATAAGDVVFQGAAVLTNGLSYPCFPPAVPPSSPFASCPGTGASATYTVLAVPVTYAIGGNVRGFTLATRTCVGAATVVGNPGGSPVVAGTCWMVAGGTLVGHCGLSHGRGTALLVFEGTTTGTVTVGTQFQWADVGGVLVVTSGPSSALTTSLVGVIHAIAVPQVTPAPAPSISNSCVDRSATRFDLAGSLTFVDLA